MIRHQEKHRSFIYRDVELFVAKMIDHKNSIPECSDPMERSDSLDSSWMIQIFLSQSKTNGCLGCPSTATSVGQEAKLMSGICSMREFRENTPVNFEADGRTPFRDLKSTLNTNERNEQTCTGRSQCSCADDVHVS